MGIYDLPAGKQLHYDLRTPCDDCPFLRGNKHEYTENALGEYIARLLEGSDIAHTCHKTDPRSDCKSAQDYKGEIQHCAGAMILSIRERRIPDQLAAAIFAGKVNRKGLNMKAGIPSLRELMVRVVKCHIPGWEDPRCYGDTQNKELA